MAERDITVNIRGNGSSGGSTPPDDPTGASERISASVDSLVQELRTALTGRGVNSINDQNFADTLRDVEASMRKGILGRIGTEYDLRREAVSSQYGERLSALDRAYEDRRKQYTVTPGGSLLDPEGKPLPIGRTIDQDLGRWYSARSQGLNGELDRQIAPINEEEARARSGAERELTEAMRVLTDEYKRKDVDDRKAAADNPTTYLSKLRLERKEALADLEAAESRPDAIAAATRARRASTEIAAVMRGEAEGGIGGIGATGTIRGAAGMVRNAASGNLMGTAMGGLGMLGLGSTALTVGAIGGAIYAVGAAVNNVAHGINDYQRLAAYRGIWRGHPELEATGNDALRQASATVSGASIVGAGGEVFTRAQLGISREAFMNQAANILSTSGVLENWSQRTFRAMANEQQFNLAEGTIAQLSKYDRYQNAEGYEANRAVAELATLLSEQTERGNDTGISSDNYVRMRERVAQQQSLMEFYRGRYNNPQYRTANAMISAFSAVPGGVQDDRLTPIIQGVTQGVANIGDNQNPMFRAIAFRALQAEHPELDSYDKLYRYFRSPETYGGSDAENIATVLRAVQQFGGLNSAGGYFSLLGFFRSMGLNLTEDQLRAYASPEGLSSDVFQQAYKNARRGKGGLTNQAQALMNENVSNYGNMRTGVASLFDELSEISRKLAEAFAGYNTAENVNEVYAGK